MALLENVRAGVWCLLLKEATNANLVAALDSRKESVRHQRTQEYERVRRCFVLSRKRRVSGIVVLLQPGYDAVRYRAV